MNIYIVIVKESSMKTVGEGCSGRNGVGPSGVWICCVSIAYLIWQVSVVDGQFFWPILTSCLSRPFVELKPAQIGSVGRNRRFVKV